MKEIFIILTYDIHPLGGTQMYTNTKAEWLTQHGYNVAVLFPGDNFGNCVIKSLDKYVVGGNPLFASPPAFCSEKRRQEIMMQIADFVGGINKEDRIYIESHYDISALWGEYIARQLGGKHIGILVNERYRGIDKWYENYIEFFKFKYDRNELFDSEPGHLEILFQNYYVLGDLQDRTIMITDGKPVQDVSNEKIDSISKVDYNIAHIGRFSKGYVRSVIAGLEEFCKAHKDKEIQFINVGRESIHLTNRDYLLDVEKKLDNLKVIFLGDLVPIPKRLFDKVDCVIATSGCADLSCDYAPTIAVDANKRFVVGILGYTCSNCVQPKDDFKGIDFCTALEDVLINKVYENIEYQPTVFNADPNDVLTENMRLWESKEEKQEYYDVMLDEDYVLQREKRLKIYSDIYQYWLECELYGRSVESYLQKCGIKKIAIYGAGNIGKLLCLKLQKTQISVRYLIDINISLVKWHGIYEDVKAISVSEMNLMEKIDAVLVTPSHCFQEVRKDILASGLVCRIIDFADVVYEIREEINRK